MNKYDRDEINRISIAFINELDKENPIEMKVYHATKKKIWETNDNSDEDTICAKSVKHLNSGIIRYFVKRCSCEFYDNTHISPIYHRRLWRLGPVSEQAFKYYIAFLGFGDGKGKEKQYLKTKGERLV